MVTRLTDHCQRLASASSLLPFQLLRFQDSGHWQKCHEQASSSYCPVSTLRYRFFYVMLFQQ